MPLVTIFNVPSKMTRFNFTKYLIKQTGLDLFLSRYEKGENSNTVEIEVDKGQSLILRDRLAGANIDGNILSLGVEHGKYLRQTFPKPKKEFDNLPSLSLIDPSGAPVKWPKKYDTNPYNQPQKHRDFSNPQQYRGQEELRGPPNRQELRGPQNRQEPRGPQHPPPQGVSSWAPAYGEQMQPSAIMDFNPLIKIKQETESLDYKLEMIRKERLLLEEQRKLLEQKRLLENLRETSPGRGRMRQSRSRSRDGRYPRDRMGRSRSPMRRSPMRSREQRRSRSFNSRVRSRSPQRRAVYRSRSPRDRRISPRRAMEYREDTYRERSPRYREQGPPTPATYFTPRRSPPRNKSLSPMILCSEGSQERYIPGEPYELSPSRRVYEEGPEVQRNAEPLNVWLPAKKPGKPQNTHQPWKNEQRAEYHGDPQRMVAPEPPNWQEPSNARNPASGQAKLEACLQRATDIIMSQLEANFPNLKPVNMKFDGKLNKILTAVILKRMQRIVNPADIRTTTLVKDYRVAHPAHTNQALIATVEAKLHNQFGGEVALPLAPSMKPQYAPQSYNNHAQEMQYPQQQHGGQNYGQPNFADRRGPMPNNQNDWVNTGRDEWADVRY